jgi:deaminated glutathione amidase
MARVAAIQMCSSHLVRENLAYAKSLIAEASANGAKLAVLPEMFAMMGLENHDKVNIKESFGHGVIQDFLARQARENQIWLVGGTIPISCEVQNKVRAASLVFNANGQMVARYDKIHLFDVALSSSEVYQESTFTEAGNEIVVLPTPMGKLGLAVCYDLRYPELFRKMNELGAEIIALPSAFTLKTGRDHWRILTRSRAIENFCYLIGACEGGLHSNKRKTYGHSLIIDPWGKIIAEKKEITPGIIYGEIDLHYLRQIRKTFNRF